MKTATKKREFKASGMEVAGLRTLVVGAARTGIECANFLARRGAVVTVTDVRDAGEMGAFVGGLDRRVKKELGGHRKETFLAQDLVVPSPGVPKNDALLGAARAVGIPVLSEIEIAYRFLPVPTLAVTGTNGKSTVTTVTADILSHAGIPARLGGNIGNPLVGEIDVIGEEKCVVAEISSFQLEWVEQFRPRTAAVLNISEDHLDRYDSFEDYIETKAAIFARQRSGDYLVLNADDPRVREFASHARGQVFWFSRRIIPRRGLYFFRGWIYSRLGSGAPRQVMPVKEMKIVGTHNWENAMAAAAIAMLNGAPSGAVRRALSSFKGLPHRMEFVRDLGGVMYFDDSKGTNVGATASSIAGQDAPLILIAGGRDKGGSYLPLRPLVSTRVKKLILIGEAAGRIASDLEGTTEIAQAGGMEEAIREASSSAVGGDIVLLSPACSSFDQYTSYVDRGKHYQGEVWKL